MFVYPNNSVYRGQMKKKDESNKNMLSNENGNSYSSYRVSNKYSENGNENKEEITEFRHGYGI